MEKYLTDEAGATLMTLIWNPKDPRDVGRITNPFESITNNWDQSKKLCDQPWYLEWISYFNNKFKITNDQTIATINCIYKNIIPCASGILTITFLGDVAYANQNGGKRDLIVSLRCECILKSLPPSGREYRFYVRQPAQTWIEKDCAGLSTRSLVLTARGLEPYDEVLIVSQQE